MYLCCFKKAFCSICLSSLRNSESSFPGSLPGDLFGLSSLLGSEHYILEAKCAESADVLVIDSKKFRNLLETDATAGFIVMNEVASTNFNRYIEILNRFQGIVTQILLISNPSA